MNDQRPKRADTTHLPHLSRRAVLVTGTGTLLGVAGAAAFAGFGSSAVADTTSTCATATYTPEVTEGPYWVDTKLNRSDITTNSDGTEQQSGIPLTLDLTFVDSDCKPVSGAYIDIWHCNEAGVYSDISSENTLNTTWLRGYQVTDSNGAVTFVTIYPGWYVSRTIHIHVRVRTYDGTTESLDYTTQFFFDETYNSEAMTAYAAYDSQARTYNSGDSVLAEETADGSPVLLPLTGNSTTGYTATTTLLFNTTSGSGGTTGPGNGGPSGTPPSGTPPTGTPSSGSASSSPSASASGSTSGSGSTSASASASASGSSSSSASASASATPTRSATPTATPTTTPVKDTTVSAHLLLVQGVRKHGKRHITVEWYAGETLTGSVVATLKGKQIGHVTSRTYKKGRHTNTIELLSSVAHGTGVVTLALADTAGNKRKLVRHVVVPKR